MSPGICIFFSKKKNETQKYEFEIYKIKASMELSLHLAFSSEASICRCSKAVWITSFVT